MRQIHRAGAKLSVDFAGPTLPLTTGRRAHIFVAAMGASSYTFACATPAETMEDWLGGIARALTFYGGVPQLIVPDNPRAMIADPDRYEPRAGVTVHSVNEAICPLLKNLNERPFQKLPGCLASAFVQAWMDRRRDYRRRNARPPHAASPSDHPYR
jgi:hypothetical protein